MWNLRMSTRGGIRKYRKAQSEYWINKANEVIDQRRQKVIFQNRKRPKRLCSVLLIETKYLNISLFNFVLPVSHRKWETSNGDSALKRLPEAIQSGHNDGHMMVRRATESCSVPPWSALCLSPGPADNRNMLTKLSSSFRRHCRTKSSVQVTLRGHADIVGSTWLRHGRRVFVKWTSSYSKFYLFDELKIFKWCKQVYEIHLVL